MILNSEIQRWHIWEDDGDYIICSHCYFSKDSTKWWENLQRLIHVFKSLLCEMCSCKEEKDVKPDY